MRVLVIDAPGCLARDLYDRTLGSSELSIILAGRSNPLSSDANPDAFFPFHSRRKVDLKSISLLRNKIRESKVDVVHAFLPRSLSQTVLATFGLKNRPKIVSFYGITRVPTWLDPSDWITFLSPRVDRHACESHAVKDALVQGGVQESKCEVIYNCVDNVGAMSSKTELRDKYNIPAGAFVIGSIATMRPVKGIDILLRALLEVSHLPNLYAVLIGLVQDKLAADPRLKGRVQLLGEVPGAAQLLKALDVFVMPSRKEGLCRALLEAMNQGICPAVSDAGGMKEIVRDRVDGIVFPKEDPSALAEVIHELYSNRNQVEVLHSNG
jgi:glycosyltransferase involved in cell wall biosynthesis